MADPDLLSSYNYDLPPELIADRPLAQRDASRLLVLDRETGEIQHRMFRDLPSFIRPHDLLVVNETRVIPAKLTGHRTATGGRWEGLFLGVTPEGNWRLIGQTRGKLQSGETLTLIRASHSGVGDESLLMTLISRNDEGEWQATTNSDADHFTLLERFGTVPLPPYIERDSPTEDDRERYQTTYATTPGAVAAPTAGLHFTPEILDECRARGASVATVTLHVGLGTFRPIAVDRLDEHRMHHEWCELPQSTVDAITATREAGGRVIAVGTTTVRTLESAAASGTLAPFTGETNLFIRPPYEFKVIDALLTNFHLPRSTLLVLLATFAGLDQVLAAYETAIAEKYRFYSYGDAMFVCDERVGSRE
ncbi:MAG: tRNA preQ1(34) S-adenosylmethionine ribosyltransferase-isomerase QueA [Planctomycetaceae bacterium]|nr:tRNA preQ1(34) S-adenosylmethionine ribosyltransferase-isomerase QueA [Planctomycetaceae bacterium]